MDVARRHFVEVCPNKPTPKAKKKACKAKALTSIKKKIITRGAATSTHHQALLTHALWHEVMKAHPPLVTVIEMMMKKNHQLMSSRNKSNSLMKYA
jgi:hypothetical protein